MMPTTRAIVIPEAGRVELRDVTLTTPGPDDVTVQTVYTAISAGTERMLLAGRMPHPMLQFPIVPGYETVGQVVGRGENVPLHMDGQWVYIGGARCFEGVNPAWGGQAAMLHADYRRVIPLGSIDPQVGVLLALSATALHGIDLLELKPDQRVLVLGQGPVGQIAARIARNCGGWVAVADQQASRLERSVADLVIDATQPSPLAESLGTPVDVIIEATGSMDALTSALPTLATNGTILLLGYYDELRLPYMPLFLKQARLLTAREWAAGDLERCHALLADGTLDLAKLITHHMPVEQVADAYQVALNDGTCLKLVLEWPQGESPEQQSNR